MKTTAYGPTEILRFPDGHCTIVTKNWWAKFLDEQKIGLDKTYRDSSTVLSQRRTSTHGKVEPIHQNV